ncbi:MAG: hypothetical protein ACRYFS_23225 [Janthinobacterium lividum]
MTNKPIGEIIEAGTTAFVAQCLEVPREIVPRLYDPPPFGSFVKIGKPSEPTPQMVPPPLGIAGDDEEEDPFAAVLDAPPVRVSSGIGLPPAVYALVYGANTASLEPNRRPSALGFADEDEMRLQQPQIFELLRTEFSGLLIAYSEGGDKPLRRHLPPLPPRIHSRVYPCSPEETRMLTEDMSFLRSLLLPSGGSLAGVPSDELAAACLRMAREAHADDQAFLLRAGRTLATLLATDYERLQAILRNVI